MRIELIVEEVLKEVLDVVEHAHHRLDDVHHGFKQRHQEILTNPGSQLGNRSSMASTRFLNRLPMVAGMIGSTPTVSGTMKMRHSLDLPATAPPPPPPPPWSSPEGFRVDEIHGLQMRPNLGNLADETRKVERIQRGPPI